VETAANTSEMSERVSAAQGGGGGSGSGSAARTAREPRRRRLYLDLAARSEPEGAGANLAVQELVGARNAWAGLSAAAGATGTHRMHKVAVVMVCGVGVAHAIACLGMRHTREKATSSSPPGQVVQRSKGIDLLTRISATCHHDDLIGGAQKMNFILRVPSCAHNAAATLPPPGPKVTPPIPAK